MTALFTHAGELWGTFQPLIGLVIFLMYLLIDTLYAEYTFSA